MNNKWDKKYSVKEFIYGKEPNDFLKENINKITSGHKILSLGEGEGRNAIFLLKNNFQVIAIDQSSVGLKKAQAWAREENLTLTTICDDLENHPTGENRWDGIINIFAHTYPDTRKMIHSKVEKSLRPGGVYILEIYTKEQLNFDTGGPKDLELFMDLEILKKDLPNLKFEFAREIIKNVREGSGHTGKSAVVQLIARKV